MQAEVIAIGNELLLGRTQDTNTHWLAQRLTALGLPLGYAQVVPDTPEALVAALALALSRSQFIICTGGLGPTKDDLTKKTLADYFGLPLALHTPTLQHIEALYRSRGREPNASVPLQATLPVGATLLHNGVGTAPGMLFDAGEGRSVVALPGVPYEMKHLFDTHVAPVVTAQYVDDHLRQHTFRTAAVPESELALRIAAVEDNLPPELFLAYNPGLHTVDLRLNLHGPRSRAAELDALFEAARTALRDQLGRDVYAEGDTSLAQAVGALLVGRGETVSVAESCTGGQLLAALIAPAGASSYVRGGVVPYSNDLKTRLLGVAPELLAAHGAVSEPVAIALAEGARTHLGGTWGVGITGVAGPGGGTEAKPVGTVWVAISGPTGSHARQFAFEKDRGRNQQRSVIMALELLRRALVREAG